MPPVFHGQAEDRRFRRSRGQVPSQIRYVGLIRLARSLTRATVGCLLAFALTTSGGSAWAKNKSRTGDAAAAETAKESGDAALGRRYHEEIVATLGIYENEALANYVQALGEELAANAPGDNYVYRFTVLDVEMVNAFALPGGYIYVTRGLLAHLNSEAQLAAVLGHEIGHVDSRHAARQHTARRIVGKVAGSMAVEAGGFNLGTLFGAGLVSGYGRDMELEADQTGAQLLAAVGYDPHAMLEVIGVLKAVEEYSARDSDGDNEPGSGYHAMLASHPEKDRRTAELIEKALATTTELRDPGVTRYLQHIDGLAWAGSTAQGVVRENNFYHLDLDFAISFPAGWQIQNLPDRLVALPSQRDAFMAVRLYDRHPKKRRRVDIDEFLQKRLGMRRWQNGRVIDVNGLQGFVAMVPGSTTPFGERLTRVGVVYHGDSAYVFNFATEDAERPRQYDREVLQIIKSFHSLSEAERVQAAPVRVAIIEAASDTRFSDLAAATVHADERLLRLLNGLYPDGEPASGTLVKVIR